MSVIKTEATAAYLEPTLHFCRKRLGVGEPGHPDGLLVSELVRKDDVLASWPAAEPRSRKELPKAPLKAGNNSHFRPDGTTLHASVTGYPKVETLEQPGGPAMLIISVIPLIKISFDRLSATLLVYPPLPGGRCLQNQQLPELLAEAGVVHGLDQLALDHVHQLSEAGSCEASEIVIARGELPGQGTDAYLDFEFEIGPIPGLLLDDGSIDFRERRIMIGVRKSQLIATKIPAVPGAPGTNVLGEQIEPKSGKDIKMMTIGDVTYCKETRQVSATEDGVLSVVNNIYITVSSRHIINSDIDFKTGNIESKGSLVIRGSMQPGFRIDCAGDLEIGGSVVSARLSGKANIVVKGGITGKKSRITAQGDLDIKFIEQGRLAAGGIVVVRTQSYYSHITARSDIRCHPASTVMGGTLIAGGHLTVGSVGSENSEPATLGAGIDPDRLALYDKMEKELRQRQEEVIQWLQLHGTARSRKIRKMESRVEEIRLQLLKLNLVPGTELYSRVGNGASRDDLDEENPLYHSGLDVDKIRIDINGTAFRGTRILLGNRTLVLQQTVVRRRFKLSNDMKRIIALPLRLR